MKSNSANKSKAISYSAFLLMLMLGSIVINGTLFGQSADFDTDEFVESQQNDGVKIVIDPGHGGIVSLGGSSPNNSKGPKGNKEKDLALKISVKVAEYLNNNGYNVQLTRNSDNNVSIADRTKLARENKANAFVSIHFNGDASPKVQGTETWVDNARTNDCVLLASSLKSKVQGVTMYNNRGLKTTKKNRPDRIGVLKMENHYPNTAVCLLEISFLTDPIEETRLTNSNNNYVNNLAKAIYQGIDDFVKNASITPMAIEESDLPYPVQAEDP